ncbi:ATP-binding protein [Alkalihalophilus pseudofirmus]|uniref:ATP-binding protein n=1 Tax=Alkalihalophilus pseudofirmus TaxID=79885 RepID=UPI0009D78F87|nr:ATP-binding protein [Alkalihalophilus pseudofirmus]
MKKACTHLPPTIQAMTSDSNIINRMVCTGCHEKITVRRVFIPFGPEKGTEKELTYGCRCEDIELAKNVLKRRKELERKRIYQIFDRESLLNQDLLESSFDSYVPRTESQKSAYKQVREFCDTYSKDKPRNLLLTGSYGLGKSHLSSAALKVLIESGYTSIFISVPKLLTKLKATYNKHSEFSEDNYLELLEKADCVVLDDVGAEHGRDPSSWATSKLFEIIDSRIGKHTIYTTNLGGKALQDKVGARNFSRMMQKTKVIAISGPDHRLSHFSQEKGSGVHE